MSATNATMELISAERLSNLLEARGMSRRALAREIGVSAGNAIKLAAGHIARTSPERARKIEQVLNVEHGTLFRLPPVITGCRVCGAQRSPQAVAA